MIYSAGGVVGGARDEKHRLTTRSHIRNPISRLVSFASCSSRLIVLFLGLSILPFEDVDL